MKITMSKPVRCHFLAILAASKRERAGRVGGELREGERERASEGGRDGGKGREREKEREREEGGEGEGGRERE
jgi:hypothetical protein